MPETYLSIMLQSLGKKEEVLDEIIRLDDLQKETLTDPSRRAEEFDKTVEDKSACIEQLEQLDSGFEKLYAQVEKELAENSGAHAEEIRQIQEKIRNITDKSVRIQAQEARNKDLMMRKFDAVKKQAKDVRLNSKAITGYYQTMKGPVSLEPHYLDGKK